MQGHGGVITPTPADIQSVFSLVSISVGLVAVSETCSEMFSVFIINSHLRPKQCLFQQSSIDSQSATQREGWRATTFQPRHALIAVSQMETKFDSNDAVPLHVLSGVQQDD